MSNQHEGMKLLFIAETGLKHPPVRDSEEAICVSDNERRKCEELIESLGNLLAIACRCGRTISSRCPPAAFVAESDEERAFLADCRGVKVKHSGHMDALFEIPLDGNLVSGLQDRQAGVSLLAEGFSHKTAMGKYRDLIRLFELAFALPATQLVKKLSQFLTGNSQGYGYAEVASWISFRHGSSHADFGKTKVLYLEADVRALIPRMQQAALDILFNKLQWHDRSIAKRAFVNLPAKTISPQGDISMVAGTPLRMQFQAIDEFGAYRSDVSARLTSPPLEWWWKPWQREDESKKGELLVSGTISIEPPGEATTDLKAAVS
jgi:hypothetical protein